MSTFGVVSGVVVVVVEDDVDDDVPSGSATSAGVVTNRDVAAFVDVVVVLVVDVVVALEVNGLVLLQLLPVRSEANPGGDATLVDFFFFLC